MAVLSSEQKNNLLIYLMSILIWQQHLNVSVQTRWRRPQATWTETQQIYVVKKKKK